MDQSTFTRNAAVVGSISSLLLSGINFSASQLTLPILYRLPDTTSLSIFEELFYRGARTIVPLTIFSTLSAGVAAYLAPTKRRRYGYAVASFASFASLPWTASVMRSTIQTLVDLANDERLRENAGRKVVETLLRRWKWMNNVRAGLALVGGATGLAVLLGRF